MHYTGFSSRKVLFLREKNTPSSNTNNRNRRLVHVEATLSQFFRNQLIVVSDVLNPATTTLMDIIVNECCDVATSTKIKNNENQSVASKITSDNLLSLHQIFSLSSPQTKLV